MLKWASSSQSVPAHMFRQPDTSWESGPVSRPLLDRKLSSGSKRRELLIDEYTQIPWCIVPQIVPFLISWCTPAFRERKMSFALTREHFTGPRQHSGRTQNPASYSPLSLCTQRYLINKSLQFYLPTHSVSENLQLTSISNIARVFPVFSEHILVNGYSKQCKL